MKHILIVTDISLTDDFSLHTADVIGNNNYAVFGSVDEIAFRMFANSESVFDTCLNDVEFDAVIYVLEPDKWPKDYIMDRLFELNTGKVLCNGNWSMDDYKFTYIYSNESYESDMYEAFKRLPNNA